MLTKERKVKIIEKSRLHDTDTGSAEVQIGLLGEQIAKLTEHLKEFRKDNHSRRGLLKMVAKRRSLLEYLARGDSKKLLELQKRFGIKK